MNLLKVDLHTHILPERWPDLDAKYGYPGWVRLSHHGPGCARMMIGDQPFRDVGANLWDPEVRLDECNRQGVDLQVLSTVPVMFSYWARPADALDLSRLLNDHLAEVVARYPARFAGLGTVPLQAPELAIAELTRCVRELGLSGVQIGTHVDDRNLDDPALFSFFAAAAELGAAVFVHPWEMLAKARMPKYWLPWLVGMPTETALAASTLAFGGVLERLPTLRIGLAHGGGSWPWLLGRMTHGFAARPDLCAVDNPVSPEKYARRFFYDTLLHDTAALRYLVALAGAERVALGTDYPFPLGESEPGALIDSLSELDPLVRARLLGGTALEFLGRTA
ncbi:MAG: amidohydrolase family protein [Acidobacteriota bacterium]